MPDEDLAAKFLYRRAFPERLFDGKDMPTLMRCRRAGGAQSIAALSVLKPTLHILTYRLAFLFRQLAVSTDRRVRVTARMDHRQR